VYALPARLRAVAPGGVAAPTAAFTAAFLSAFFDAFDGDDRPMNQLPFRVKPGQNLDAIHVRVSGD